MASQVPKLPLISAAANPSGGGQASARSARTNGVLVSSTKTKYVPSADATDSARILSPRDLREINKYINANRGLKPQHRTGRVNDIIPEIPFARMEDPGDDVLGLRLARINPNESALDIPLRLAVPSDFHVPAFNDLPMQAGSNASLATRITTLLRGTSQVPHHAPEERIGTEKDLNHCVIIRDWQMRAAVAKRSQMVRNYALAQLALAGLYYRAGNKDCSRVYLSESAQAFEHCGDARGAALCHNLIGVANMHSERYQEALLHHRKQASLCGAYGRCVAQLNLGVCYGSLGEHENAVLALTDALQSAVEAGDAILETIAHGNLGVANMRIGNLAAAQQETEQCLERCSVAGDKVGAAVCLLLLADSYCQLSDYPHAQFYGEHALRVATEAECFDMAHIAKVTIGIARGAQGAQAAVMQSAKAMGMSVSTSQIVATLPKR